MNEAAIKECKPLDFTMPEAELRKIISSRTISVMAGMRIMDTLKTVLVQCTSGLYSILAELKPDAEEAVWSDTTRELMSIITEHSKTAFDSNLSIQPPSTDDELHTIMLIPEVAKCLDRTNALMKECVGDEKTDLSSMALRAIVASSIVTMLGLFQLIEDVYRLDILVPNDPDMARSMLVADTSMTGMLKAAITYSRVGGNHHSGAAKKSKNKNSKKKEGT